MYQVGHEAYAARVQSFKKLAEKIQDSPRRRSVRTRINQHIANVQRNGEFTAQFEQPPITNATDDEKEEIMQDIFTYYTQQGFYIESRTYIDNQTQLLKDGLFIAWDRALPSYRMMTPK